MKLDSTENPGVGGKNENNNKTFYERMNENFKCHPHIPQPRKGIYVLNIIIQNLLEKRRNEGKGTSKEHQKPYASSRGIET